MKSILTHLASVTYFLGSTALTSAGTILYYDSLTDGTSNALDRLDVQTDASFIASSSTTTTLGSNAVFIAEHGSQSNVQGLGDGLDKQFRFGSSAGGSGTMAGTMRVAHMANGPYIEMSFTAAQSMILNELSFKLFNNSNNGSNYGARDAGLFVKVSSADFIQFGDSFTSPTNNGNQGTVTFTDNFEVAKGDLVTLRIAFTDRTRPNNDAQAATRIGAINISADASPISDKLRVITYNIHGGKGPNDQGTPLANLTAFRDNFMQNEDVIALQEVDNGDCWTAVQSVFSDYPYRYRTINQETSYFFWETPKQTSVAILSKYPFTSTHNKLVNTDPTYDKWERHGQHVQIQIGHETVHIFNYHNTFDPDDGGTSSEVAGMEKFRDYVTERLGANALSQRGRVIALGDFNINGTLLNGIMPNLVQKQTDWVDHVAAMSNFTTSGVYATTGANISDHDAVWASLDLAAPSTDPLTWASDPEETGTTSISMTANTATDANGVEYYFTNTSIANGSHDSGWQSSPTYVDTGLSPATSYSYTVKTRDQSANVNESGISEVRSAYTDDGDSVPNDWELLHFPNLNTTSGAAEEDWDHDGSSDFEEWVAGTDPIDANSKFYAWIEDDVTHGMTLKWPVVIGKTYQVLYSTNLDSDWKPATGELSPEGAEGIFPIDITGKDYLFYRVKVNQ